MCYPAPSQFWALPQPELKHKSEENYPDSKNKFFCRSFFFSSCGQYCSRPCNPIPSLQLTIWWAYFSSVTQQKPLLFFFLDETSTGLVTWISSSRAREEQRRGEKKWEGGGKQDILILAYNHTPNIELTTELSTQIQSLISAPCIIYFVFTFSFFFIISEVLIWNRCWLALVQRTSNIDNEKLGLYLSYRGFFDDTKMWASFEAVSQ